MFPTLFELHGVKVNTYGAFVSLAHLAGIGAVLFTLRARNRSLDPYVDLIFAVMLSGLIGARAGYILEHPSEFSSPWEWVQLWKGGLSLFAGLLAGFPAYVGMLLWRRLPVWESSDLLVPVLPFSLALVRIGCFGAGCCHGTPTELPWGVRPGSELIPFHLAGENLHPTQLYESLFLLVLCGFLVWLARRKPAEGVVVTSFLLAYASYRLLVNPLRGDLEISPTLGINSAQAGAGILLIVSVFVLCWRIFRAGNTRHPNQDSLSTP